MDPRRGKREHPPDVGRRDEMPRWPHHVRTEDGTLVEYFLDIGVGDTFCAQTERPFRTRVILSLDGAQPGDDVGRLANVSAAEFLVAESLTDQIERNVARQGII
jgi:hypothetical protein